MSWWGDYEVSEHRRELLRVAGERRLARFAREGDGNLGGGTGVDLGIGVRWGREADEEEVAGLLQLNGMSRWIAFEERFVVAERDGEIVAALRYRMEPKKLVLGLLVADPWAGEPVLATALYAGAGELAREIGAKDVQAQAGAPDYLAEAGYRWRGRGWHLDVTRPAVRREQLPAGGWRRVVALLGVVGVPFFKPFER